MELIVAVIALLLVAGGGAALWRAMHDHEMPDKEPAQKNRSEAPTDYLPPSGPGGV